MRRNGLWAPAGRVLLYAAVFLLFHRLNQMTDFTADDFIYHYHFQAGPPDGSTRLLTGPWDIVSSIATHYQLQNGRNVAHAILQFFFLFDKAVFDVANSVVLVALGPLVLAHVFARRGFTILHEAAVYLTMWLFIPYFGQAALWMSGAVNYLWMSFLTLATLLPFRLHAPGRAPSPAWLGLVMLPVGSAAGNANENSGGAWILLAVLFIVGWVRAGGRVPLWAWAGVVGAVGGLVVQLVSPGNQKRAEKLAGTVSETTPFDRIPYLAQVAWDTSGVLFVVFVALLVVFLVGGGRLTGEPAIALQYVVAGAASGAAMVMTPTMPHRSWIWTVLFLVIAIGVLGRAWQAPSRFKLALLSTALVVLGVWGAVVYAQAHASIQQTHREVAEELRVIAEHKARGELDVVVTKFRLPTNRHNALAYTGNLRDDPNHSFNRWFAHYYGLDSIRIDNPEQMYR